MGEISKSIIILITPIYNADISPWKSRNLILITFLILSNHFKGTFYYTCKRVEILFLFLIFIDVDENKLGKNQD